MALLLRLLMVETIDGRTAAAALDFIAVHTEFAERGTGRTRDGTKHLRPRTHQVVVLQHQSVWACDDVRDFEGMDAKVRNLN